MNKKIDEKVNELKKEIKQVKEEVVIVRDYVIGVDTRLNEHEVILKRAK